MIKQIFYQQFCKYVLILFLQKMLLFLINKMKVLKNFEHLIIKKNTSWNVVLSRGMGISILKCPKLICFLMLETINFPL